MFCSFISKFFSVSIFRRVSYILKSFKVLFSSGPLLLGILNQTIIASFMLRYWVSVEVHHIEKYDFYFVLCLRKSRCCPGNVLLSLFLMNPDDEIETIKNVGKSRLFCCKRIVSYMITTSCVQTVVNFHQCLNCVVLTKNPFIIQTVFAGFYRKMS